MAEPGQHHCVRMAMRRGYRRCGFRAYGGRTFWTDFPTRLRARGGLREIGDLLGHKTDDYQPLH
jgi:hypothetical protein